MVYTVNQLAKLAGVSVRTLHHYDYIGLLKPTYVKENRYRYYGDKELMMLQQILFFRELDFPLEQIKKMLQAPRFNMLAALGDQQKLIHLKKKRLEQLLITISNTMNSLQNNTKINDTELYEGFSEKQMEEYKEEAKKRWGETNAYKQSMERTKDWTNNDYKRIAEEGKKFTQKLADAMDKDIKSPEVQALVAEHRKGIEVFYDCSDEMHRNLGVLYITDPRFKKYYEDVKPGLAQWLHDAILYYCDQSKSAT